MPIYRSIYDGPPRWYTDQRTHKKYIMIHATANDASAEAEASYAKRRSDRVSSHYYVDDDSIVQSLDTHLRAWHAGNSVGNDRAIAYELTARNVNVGRAWWLDLDNIEWPLFTGQVAADCRAHGITPQTLTDAQLRAGSLTGITTHVQGNRVWGGSDHVDPGPNFPMNHLVRQVQAALNEEDDVSAKDVWGHRMQHPTTGGHLTAEERIMNTAINVHRMSKIVPELAAQVAAIRATQTGGDPIPALRAELDRHRELLLNTLSEDLVDAVRAELDDVPDELAAVMNRALDRIRVVVTPDTSDIE